MKRTKRTKFAKLLRPEKLTGIVNRAIVDRKVTLELCSLSGQRAEGRGQRAEGRGLPGGGFSRMRCCGEGEKGKRVWKEFSSSFGQGLRKLLLFERGNGRFSAWRLGEEKKKKMLATVGSWREDGSILSFERGPAQNFKRDRVFTSGESNVQSRKERYMYVHTYVYVRYLYLVHVTLLVLKQEATGVCREENRFEARCTTLVDTFVKSGKSRESSSWIGGSCDV